MPPALMNLLSKAYQEGSPNMATGTKPTSKWLVYGLAIGVIALLWRERRAARQTKRARQTARMFAEVIRDTQADS